MTLVGAFATMPLPDVLGWLDGTARSGGLTVAGPRHSTLLLVEDRRIRSCASTDPQALLGQFLLFHGAITEADLERGMIEHRRTGRRVGEILVDFGALSAETLGDLLLAKATESALAIFDDDKMSFTFDPEVPEPANATPVDLEIGEAIARGRKRAEETAAARAVLQRPGLVLRKTGKPPTPKLSSMWVLRLAYGAVDGERSIEEIARRLHGTQFQVLRRLYELYLEGFIELAARQA